MTAFGIPVMFDVEDVDDRERALVAVVAHLTSIKTDGECCPVQSWWLIEAEDKHADGNDNAAGRVVFDAAVTDCRQPEGVAVGLIDSMIFAARALARIDYPLTDAVRGAVNDLASDEDVLAVLRMAVGVRSEVVDAPRAGGWLSRFAHNVIAHPLLVLCPPVGEWLHERTEP